MRDSIATNIVASGSVSSAIVAVTNPLDCLRVRWQVLPDAAPSAGGLWGYFRLIVREEGLLRGLWLPGIGSNVLAVFTCGGVRVGVYPPIRDALASSRGKDPMTMAAGGLLAGAISFFLSTPFFLAKTQLQAEAGRVDARTGLFVTGARVGEKPVFSGGMPSVFSHAVRTGGPLALLRGSSALVVRGSLLSMGHLAGYDGAKTGLKRRGLMREGPALHLVGSIWAALLAVTASCPADRVMTEFQSAPNRGIHYAHAGECALSIARTEGPMGFMRGWWPLFMRIGPTFAMFGTAYEAVRRSMGLDYY